MIINFVSQNEFEKKRDLPLKTASFSPMKKKSGAKNTSKTEIENNSVY